MAAYITASSTKSKSVAILGSTGIQGASVLHYLLKQPTTSFQLHALTQSPIKPHSPALPSLADHRNLTVHQADPTDISTLIPIFQGKQVVYGNTNTQDPRFFSPDSKLTEVDALRNIVDASVAANVELLILSTMPDIGAIGEASPGFKNKVEGMRYAREVAQKTGLRVVFVQVGWYLTNFVEEHDPKVNEEDGVVEFFMTGTYTDLGPIVKAIIDHPEPYLNSEIPIVGELLTMEQIASTYQKITSQPARAINPISTVTSSPSEIPLRGAPMETILESQWMALMAILNAEAYLTREEENTVGRALYQKEMGREMTTWEEWLRETAFDAKKENYGEKIKAMEEKWGGRKFF
ncbi:hypothetical protein BDZ91DRAFT_791590 [Kalaharituber pfeilii]|nr:hypothetical protein BDZ91DRAFT_791590 [Kalaharituber pfeilii]